MTKKINKTRPKELKVEGLYDSNIPGNSSQPRALNNNKEFWVLIVTIVLSALGVCYKIGKVEAEFRVKIEHTNEKVNELVLHKQEISNDITNIKINLGRQEAELQFIKNKNR